MRVFKAILRISLSKFLIYKSTSILVVIFSLLFSIAEYLLGYIYFNYTDNLGGYSYYDFILLITTSKIIFFTYEILFVVSHSNLIEGIIEGTIDYDILRPVDSMNFLSCRELEFSSLISILLPIGILGVILSTYQLTVLGVLLFFFMLTLGVLLYYHINQFVINLAFWIEKPYTIFGFVEDMFDLGVNPKRIFPGMIYIIFTYIFPILMITNLPIEVLKGSVNYFDILYLILFYLALRTINRFLWRKGISRYSVSC